MIVQGPLLVTYGESLGSLVARFQSTRAEGMGSELVLAEGTYDLAGVLPKAVTEVFSAKEAMGGVRGVVKMSRTQIAGCCRPDLP